LSWEACADLDHALSDLVHDAVAAVRQNLVRDHPAKTPTRPSLRSGSRKARTTQDVFSFDSDDGLKTIVAKAAAGDAIWFLATVNRIAEILAARSDTDPIGPGGPSGRSLGPGRLRRYGCRGCQVRIQPLLGPTEVAPVDGYEIPAQLPPAVRVRQIADVFPFGTCLSPHIDIDRTERYVSMDYGGPPVQTRLGNVGPMVRPGHGAATHGGWQKHQPEPGYFVHRSPTGYVYIVTNQGTLALGPTAFSAAVWEASKPIPAAIPA
jgi:hypothetical protein